MVFVVLRSSEAFAKLAARVGHAYRKARLDPAFFEDCVVSTHVLELLSEVLRVIGTKVVPDPSISAKANLAAAPHSTEQLVHLFAALATTPREKEKLDKKATGNSSWDCLTEVPPFPFPCEDEATTPHILAESNLARFSDCPDDIRTLPVKSDALLGPVAKKGRLNNQRVNVERFSPVHTEVQLEQTCANIEHEREASSAACCSCGGICPGFPGVAF